jgi:predicted kinase
MATWHLVAGSTGAGKTTAAREIAERVGGVRFSIDEWMTALYWMDCLGKNDFPWALERVGRCEAQIEAVAKQLAGVGVSSVLDLGFTTREQRMAWLEKARAAGVECVLHVLEVETDVRWQRVCERNRGESGTYAFEVTREMFCFMEERWEAPSVEERGEFGPARTAGVEFDR